MNIKRLYSKRESWYCRN